MAGYRSLRKLSPLRRIKQTTGLVLFALLLPGCQSITGSPTLSLVRVIDASPDAGGLDIYQGTGVLAYNLGLGTVTSYIPISPGTYTIQADKAGTRQQMALQTSTFALNAQYTVLIGDQTAGIQEMILKDQSQPTASNQVALRILDQAARPGPLDVYLIPSGSTLIQVHPFVSSVVPGQNTGYLDVPAGSYTLAALPAGAVPSASTVTSYTGPAVTYSVGSARTIVLLDQPVLTSPGIQVIVADDFDSATQI